MEAGATRAKEGTVEEPVEVGADSAPLLNRAGEGTRGRDWAAVAYDQTCPASTRG